MSTFSAAETVSSDRVLSRLAIASAVSVNFRLAKSPSTSSTPVVKSSAPAMTALATGAPAAIELPPAKSWNLWNSERACALPA